MKKAMLGNMTKESGNVSYSGKLAFIPQEAWIRNGSVRDNVIFSLPYEKEKYKKEAQGPLTLLSSMTSWAWIQGKVSLWKMSNWL